MPPKKKAEPTWRDLLPSELEMMRTEAVAAGYVDPYPDLGVAPTADIDEDRCTGCGWTLFVSLVCAVYCINEKCPEHHRDLTEEEPNVEPAVSAAVEE